MAWIVETPEEVEAREQSYLAEAQAAERERIDREVALYGQECREWAKEIFLYHEMGNCTVHSTDWFNLHLIGLIHKADGHNRRRIAKGFPIAVKLFEEWESSEPWTFYTVYEVRELLRGGAADHYDAVVRVRAKETELRILKKMGVRLEDIGENLDRIEQEIEEMDDGE